MAKWGAPSFSEINHLMVTPLAPGSPTSSASTFLKLAIFMLPPAV